MDRVEPSLRGLIAYAELPNPRNAPVGGEYAERVLELVEHMLAGRGDLAPVSKATYDAAMACAFAAGDPVFLDAFRTQMLKAHLSQILTSTPESIVAELGPPLLGSVQALDGRISVSFPDYLGKGLRGRLAFQCQEIEGGRIRLTLDVLLELALATVRRLRPSLIPEHGCEGLHRVAPRATALLRRGSLERRRHRGRGVDMQGGRQEGRYPPCIQGALRLLSEGKPPNHAQRFDLVTFLHATGTERDGILDAFRVLPGFSERVTGYQIDHILRGPGTEDEPRPYSVRSCAKIKALGNCLDSTCPGRTPVREYLARLESQ